MTGSLHIGLAAIGSAIGVGIIGMKAAEATGRNPGAAGAIRNQAILFAALAEGVVFIAIFLGKRSVIAQAHSVGQVTARRFPPFQIYVDHSFFSCLSESGDCGH